MRDMYLLQAKKPSESKGEWDLMKVVATISRRDAFRPLSESECPLIKSRGGGCGGRLKGVFRRSYACSAFSIAACFLKRYEREMPRRAGGFLFVAAAGSNRISDLFVLNV